MAQSIAQENQMLKFDNYLNIGQLFSQITNARPDNENRVKGD